MADEKLIVRLKGNADYKEVHAAGAAWEDPFFRHDKSVLTGLPGNYNWLRASEIFRGREKIYDSFSGDDIEQGDLGDCYMLSAISALAEFPGRVQKLFPLRERHPSGCYPVSLFVSGKFVEVVVDDYFPVNAQGKPAFAGSKNGELWVMLLEKAWAKVHGGFAVVEGGDSRESLAALTGAPVEYYRHRETSPEQLWQMLKSFDRANYVMCTGADKDVKGIVSKHAYTLANAFEFTHEGKNVRLLQIRNPWGCTEWQGAWGDQDSVWNSALNAKLNHVSKDDGTFFMPFEDFYSIFIHSFVARCRDDFVISTHTFRQAEAFAAFKIKGSLEGFISAYQISSRLGKSVLGKAYAVEKLKIELYKLEGTSLKLVKEAWQNAVGPAHLEIQLESGMYVVHAAFDRSDVEFPIINLVAYADKTVDMAELKVRRIGDISPQLAQTAIQSIQKVFKIAEKSKLSCAFNTCLMGHPLEWTASAAQGNDGHVCENCRDTSGTGWICRACLYFVCTKCRPKEVPEEEIKKSFTGGPTCQGKHPMSFQASKDLNSLFICDRCGRAHLGTIKRWMCETCGYDLCRSCSPPPAGYKEEGKLPEIDTCFNGHQLVFAAEETHSGKYECTICSKVGTSCDGRWVCHKCNFNMCVVCKPYEQAAGCCVNAKTKTIVCTKGHMLHFTCTPPPEGFLIECDKCGKRIHKNNWRWNCEKCQFDVCEKCRRAPEGRRDVICPHNHMLIYSYLPDGPSTYERCDKCRKTFCVYTGRSCCTLCQYDLCKKCLQPDSPAIARAERLFVHAGFKAVRENCCCSII